MSNENTVYYYSSCLSTFSYIFRFRVKYVFYFNRIETSYAKHQLSCQFLLADQKSYCPFYCNEDIKLSFHELQSIVLSEQLHFDCGTGLMTDI